MGLSSEFRTANRRAQQMRKRTPRATAARYNPGSRRIVISLGPGLELVVAPQLLEGLENATPAQLSKIEISPSGFGLHFPKLDADIYLPALMQGVLGSKKWMAAQLGTLGGRQTSAAKRRAARTNGKLGGRPKKVMSA